MGLFKRKIEKSNKWMELFEQVEEGDILTILKNTKTNHFDEKTIYKGIYGDFQLGTEYKAEVIKKYDKGFITTLVKDPLWQPIAWKSYYNFSVIKITKSHESK